MLQRVHYNMPAPQQNQRRRHKSFSLGSFVLLLLLMLWLWLWRMTLITAPLDPPLPQQRHHQPPQNTTTTLFVDNKNQDLIPSEIQQTRCVLVLYGLPRAFVRLVLPSLQQHVFSNLRRYQCDVYVHWYSDTTEASSRSGVGGSLEPIHMLQEALVKAVAEHSSTAHVHFATMDTNATFWNKYEPLMQRIYTTKGSRAFRKQHAVDPRLLYWPVKDASYTARTLENVVKSWHSMQTAFAKMSLQSTDYHRVAMLRSDALYTTPLDIWKVNTASPSIPPARYNNRNDTNNNPHSVYDVYNQYAVVPGGFAMYPINDRLIYGPTSAIRIWAAQRFALLDEHVQRTILRHDPGFGMHNERFLFYTIFPRIQLLPINKNGPYPHNVSIRYDADICLLRVRADHSVWINDCGNDVAAHNRRIIEETIVQARCRPGLPLLDSRIHTRVIQLQCDNLL